MSPLLGLLLVAACPGGVQLSGPASAELSKALPAEPCTSVQVVARKTTSRFEVTLRRGAIEQVRSFRSPESAATWIRSWMRGDLLNDLLPDFGAAPSDAPRAHRRRETAPPPDARAGGQLRGLEPTGAWPPSASAFARRSGPTPSKIRVSVAVEPAAGSEGSLWGGVGLGWSWAVPLRPEVGLRASRSLPHRPRAELSAVERTQIDLRVGGGHRFTLDGGLQLGFGLGIGASWIHAARSDAGRDGCVTDCPPLIPDGFTDATVQPLGELSIEAWLPLSDRLRAGIVLRGSAYPLARGEILPEYAASNPNPQWALPGEPTFVGRFGLGMELTP